MKQYITILFTAFTLGITGISAQPRMVSDKATYDFGQVEWKKPVTVSYSISNKGDKPLVLSNITTSCACAVAEWTKTPIAPGENGTVSVTYDAKALGHFNKSVGIYSNSTPNLVYLNFKGEVVREVTDYSHQLPYSIGDIMIDQTEIDFPDVNRGTNPKITMTVVNQSGVAYEPILMHLPPYILMEKEPAVLQKGEKGLIRLTLDTERLSDLGLTQTSVYLARFAGDKVSDENEIPVSVVLLPDFSDLSDTEKKNAPYVSLSEYDIDISQKLEKKNKVNYDITVTNKGYSPLEISKLQVFNPAIGVDLKKATLEPGDKTRLRISLDKRNLTRKRNLRVLMITNDPSQPKVVINIKAFPDAK